MAKEERQFRAIPKPRPDMQALYNTIDALVENVEVLTGQRRAKGLADQVNELKAQAEGRTARFDEYVETSTKDGTALAQRITTLEAEVDQNDEKTTARFTSVERAYADADQAIASRVDTVSARADGISAEGQLQFKASAGSAGYTAQFDLTLTAGNALAGLAVKAFTDGAGVARGEIEFTANSLTLFDPMLNRAKPVFNYMSGTFTFNVPVRFGDEVFFDGGIRGIKLQDFGVSNRYYARNANPSFYTNGVSVFDVEVRENATVDISALYDGEPTIRQPADIDHRLYVYRVVNGVETEVANVILSRYDIDPRDPNLPGVARYYLSTNIFLQDNPPAGVYGYKAITQNGRGPLTLKVLVLYK